MEIFNPQFQYKILHKPIKLLAITQSKNENLKKNEFEIDKLWSFAKTQGFFDGNFLNFSKMEEVNSEIIIKGSFINYKYLFAHRRQPNLDLNIKPVGVSGITVIKNKKNVKVLFAQRNQNVLDFPGFYELVPSGTLDNQILSVNGSIDYKKKLLMEFSEEISINNANVNQITELAIIFDKQQQTYDVCCLLEANNTDLELLTAIQRSAEYCSPIVIDIKNLRKFVEDKTVKIVPTSKQFIDIFLKKYTL